MGVSTDPAAQAVDPAVARFAERYFGFVPTGATHTEDARTFLRHATGTYDFIVHDTFTGGAAPEHLLSLEVVRQLRRLLRPGGVLALDMVGFQRGAHAADADKVKCYGINSCKGTGGCAGAGHGCAGKNACKGQGFVETSKDDCAKKGGKLTAPESK